MSPKKNEFLDEMKYIDGITIIDADGRIQYSIKFNPYFYPEIGEEHIIGKTLDEVFTNIDKNTSTLYSAINREETIIKKCQKVEGKYDRVIETMNISMPIKANGKVIGAIELSKEITDKKAHKKHIIEFDKALFQRKFSPDFRFGADKARYSLDDIIGKSSKILDIKNQIRSISDINAPVFIYGETGTGKELFAHAIHRTSSRSENPFISQNCAAIPENLLESLLFGSIKGSYTGAMDTPGIFELADGGTLFLDEINSMPIALQAKLLRVLEDGYIRRVGGKKEKKIDVRIICASNEEPINCVNQNTLRRDIYYRLCVLYYSIPPLRERIDDISELTEFFIHRYNQKLGRNINKVSMSVFEFLKSYDWPGNVRELEHFIQYGISRVSKEDEVLDIYHIKSRIDDLEKRNTLPDYVSKVKLSPMKESVEALEKKLIKEAISKTGRNISKAARLLEIPRQTLQKKIKKYDLE